MLSTKDKILDAVISYIQEEPILDRISVSQIAQRAGFGKSTVYDHFETKDALLEEAYLYLLDKYQGLLIKDIPYTTYHDSMIKLLSNILDIIKNAKLIMDVIFNTEKDIGLFNFNKCSIKIKSIQEKMEEVFSKIALIGIQEKLIVLQINPYIPNVIQALISGLMFQYVNGKIDITENDLLELVYQEITRVMKS